MTNKYYFVLDNQDTFEVDVSGYRPSEVIFSNLVLNTSMYGYEEIATDPSYKGESIVMTYPLIDNMNFFIDNIQSNSIYADAIIVEELSNHEFNDINTFTDFLLKHKKPCIHNIDTRMLTKLIRAKTVKRCAICKDKNAFFAAGGFKKFINETIIHKKSQETKIIKGFGKKKIALIDFGIKNAIIKNIQPYASEIHIIGHLINAKKLLDDNFHAVFLSNGPGDPADYSDVIHEITTLFNKMPLFGICLGYQLLWLALGGKTYKMPFGHRGGNHPVIDLNGKVTITTQNHGYTIDTNYIPENCIITHVNVNDKTPEGFMCEKLQIYGVQFHPEGNPGPNDMNYIFKNWFL